jgi:hypothetical protein
MISNRLAKETLDDLETMENINCRFKRRWYLMNERISKIRKLSTLLGGGGGGGGKWLQCPLVFILF